MDVPNVCLMCCLFVGIDDETKLHEAKILKGLETGNRKQIGLKDHVQLIYCTLDSQVLL